jgi:hypothetical protein
VTSRLRQALGALALLAAVAGAASAQEPVMGRPDTTALVSDSLVGRPDSTAAADTTRKKTDVSAQDSPQDRGIVIRSADRSLQLRVLGSIRVFGSFDFEGLPRADAFSPYEIPVPDGSGTDRFYMDARQTRLGFETTWQKPGSSHTLFARIEADFAGTNNAFRLRHAYIRVDDNRIILGQTWTAFTDIAVVPLTVDLDGPASSITVRSAQVRFTQPVGKGLSLAGSIESPSIDVLTSTSEADQTYQSFPDVVGQVRYIRPGLRAQGAAVFRVLAAGSDSTSPERVPGIGLMGSVQWQFRARQTLGAQLVVGQGISRYVKGLSGRGLDLLRDPEDGSYVAPPIRGAYVSYSLVPRAGVTLNAILGGLWAPARDFYPPEAYRRGGSLAVNGFFPVFDGMQLGAEAIYGWRTNQDGQSGDAFRLQARATYDF